jgi:hypothetical protein
MMRLGRHGSLVRVVRVHGSAFPEERRQVGGGEVRDGVGIIQGHESKDGMEPFALSHRLRSVMGRWRRRGRRSVKGRRVTFRIGVLQRPL